MASMWYGNAGKREFLAQTCAKTRITRLMERLPKRNVLIVLTYHRIGSAAECPFDSGVFSATASEFENQIAHLKSQFRLVNLEQAIRIAQGQPAQDPCVLVTFDDGYIDNYAAAYPILARYGVQGVFFLSTSFVGSANLPWWDRIAYTVKNSRVSQISLTYPVGAAFEIQTHDTDLTIAAILRLYKDPRTTSKERFCAELEAACQASPPVSGDNPCFLNWDQAREMLRGGMAFGSHTHSHPILSGLPYANQLDEMRRSREILTRELGTPIDTLAYPVGSVHAFSPDSVRALKEAGYRAGFSFYGGINVPGATDPFNIRRVAVNRQSYSRFRLQTALGAITGAHWI